MAVCLANLVAALVVLRSLTSSAPAPKHEAPALATPRRAHDSGDVVFLETFDAYVVGKENAPGVVVLQEWWGIDYEVKNHAIHISQIDDGYKALIRDLYRGKVALEVAEAQHLMEGLDWPGAIKDIQASVKWLKENGSPKGPKLL
ncbi:uncharacterized protein LOC123402970 [Hordeum vulgare subsp. vulgare]|uniref:uncharacterized protein LOC123402970 n=1 Tax=Hordeum vulgare subsp. vulgare TaxID=112509 RepID=UPI001D1A5457|nr:uncharacterized protein LOC123402970 [Hordeum vulgare subsp. vulgare]